MQHNVVEISLLGDFCFLGYGDFCFVKKIWNGTTVYRNKSVFINFTAMQNGFILVPLFLQTILWMYQVLQLKAENLINGGEQ